MKLLKSGLFLILGAALIAGCSKKVEQTSVSTTGFDSLSTEDLSQLPPSASGTSAPVEALPIETSPMTQSLPALPASVEIPMTTTTSGATLSYQQKIQTALKNAGLYSGAIDGKIGPASRKAIETFQKNNGLTVDGKVGPKTWAALEPYLNSAPSVSTAAQE